MRSRAFRARYRELISAADELSPGFWMELAEEFRRMREARITTRRAVMWEFLAQREAGVMAVAATRDAAAETIVVARRETATQMERVQSRIPSLWKSGVLRSWNHPGTAPVNDHLRRNLHRGHL